MEQLRTTKEEVENLRNEEQQKCFGEMPLNRNYSEGHSCEVAKRITNERSCRVPGTKGKKLDMVA
jgi:hypothetical protein